MDNCNLDEAGKIISCAAAPSDGVFGRPLINAAIAPNAKSIFLTSNPSTYVYTCPITDIDTGRIDYNNCIANTIADGEITSATPRFLVFAGW